MPLDDGIYDIFKAEYYAGDFVVCGAKFGHCILLSVNHVAFIYANE